MAIRLEKGSHSFVSFSYSSDPRPADTPALMHGEEAGVPCLGQGMGGTLPLDDLHATNQERNATQVWTRQSLTFAPWVSRLFVR